MLNFFIEGGFGMFPVLILCLFMVVSSGKYAVTPDLHRLRFLVAMVITVVATVAHATLTDLAMVLQHVEDPARTPDAELVRTILMGLKESTRPALLGGTFVTFALILICVGLYRAGRQARI